MKQLKMTLFLLFAGCFLTGCVNTTAKQLNQVDPNAEYVEISQYLTVENSDPSLVLMDNKDALSLQGLYYATWVMGESKEYENADKDVIDLYDAQLYLLLQEAKDEDAAQANMDSWLAATKSNYEILEETEITCNDQSYTLISYNCISEENPYDHGVSAFTTFQKSAACMELTCQKDFDGDLNAIMTDFLNRCQYHGN